MNSNLLQDTESRKHYVYATSRHKAGAGSDLYDDVDCTGNMTYSSDPVTRSGRSSKAQGCSLSLTPTLAIKSVNRENVLNDRSMQHPLSESKAQPFPEYLRYKIHPKEEQQEMYEQEQSHYAMRRQEHLINEKEEEVEAERVVMCNQYDAHHLHNHGHQQQRATIRYPSRDLRPQKSSPLNGTTDLKGIKTECLNKPVCAHSHTEQICRDGSCVTRINGSLKERKQYNGARNKKHVNRYELFSQLHDSICLGVNFENKSEHNTYGNCGEVARDGGVRLREGYGYSLNLDPANIPSSYCSDKQSSPRAGMAVAINSISTCEGIVSDENQSRKHSTLAPGSKLGSNSLIPSNFMSASLSSYKIANTLRGGGRGRERERESTNCPSERSLRSKSAGSISESVHKPTSHERSARSVSPRRQDGYSVTQGHYMGHMRKRGDVPGVLSEPKVHLHRHPQALSPSLVQPPFRPAGWGESPSSSPVLISDPHGDSCEDYRFCTMDLSPSGDGTLFLKAVRRKNGGEQDRIMRSAARERLFKPTRPIGERLCGARPVFKCMESPSTFSDAPSSRFLRDINEGVTPNLREYKETNNSPIRCVFKPSGGSCDIPTPLQEYDQRIKGALSSSSHPHPYPLLEATDCGPHCPQVSFVNIDMRHPSPPTPSSSPPFLQALTESISAVASDFEVNTGRNDDVANNMKDSFGTSNSPWQCSGPKFTSRSIEYSSCTTSIPEEENTIEGNECLNPLELSQNTLYPANDEEGKGEGSIDEVENPLLSHESP